jgi:hypothetical protein
MMYFVSIHLTSPRLVYYFECLNCKGRIENPRNNPGWLSISGLCDICIEDSNTVYWEMVRLDGVSDDYDI